MNNMQILMKTKTNNSLAGYWIRRFLTEYLTGMRNLSVNTLHSYRDTVRLMMPFIGKALHKSIDEISIEDLPKENIIMFLDYLETEIGCFA